MISRITNMNDTLLLKKGLFSAKKKSHQCIQTYQIRFCQRRSEATSNMRSTDAPNGLFLLMNEIISCFVKLKKHIEKQKC